MRVSSLVEITDGAYTGKFGIVTSFVRKDCISLRLCIIDAEKGVIYHDDDNLVAVYVNEVKVIQE